MLQLYKAYTDFCIFYLIAKNYGEAQKVIEEYAKEQNHKITIKNIEFVCSESIGDNGTLLTNNIIL